MSSNKQSIPTEINLHSKSRLLSISFDDGQNFQLPCEYLRVFSHAAEVTGNTVPETGKENVNIDRMEPQGSYAIRIIFDDGHDTGIYSWATLYALGRDYEQNWANYLQRLEKAGYSRSGERTGEQDGKRQLTVLYFAYLVNMMGKESEQFELPPSVTDIQSLLAWLRKRKLNRGYLLADDNVRFTVNKHFAELFTRLDDGDEVALVPVTPNPPSPPKK